MHDVSLTLFALTSLALIITPGQDMILVMSRSITQGATAGIVTAAGVSTGLLGHTLLAALGLGAILQASEWLFVALKLAGAAYLLYLGYGLLRARDATLVLQAAAGVSYPRLFANGALSNLSNPKVAIFFFAFLPQFVHPGHAHPALRILALGVAYALLAFAVKGPIGLCAGLLSGWLRSRPAVLTGMYRCSGLVMITLGLRLACQKRS